MPEPQSEPQTKRDRWISIDIRDDDQNSRKSSVSDVSLEQFWAGELTYQGRVYGNDRFPSSFVSVPAPPDDLWDTDDVQFLDKVSCQVWIRLTHVNPKNGRFDGRMKFHWSLRVLNFEQRTEPLKRVPGIRMPGLFCEVEESRVWRRVDLDVGNNIAWQGITVLSFHGYEIFEVNDFPYDRQVIDLNLLEFVWRENKSSDSFYEGMKIVSFTSNTISMLPEWHCFPAIIDPIHVTQLGTGPTYATRFLVKLRLERKETYYIYHVCMVTYFITSAALLPLALAPNKQFQADRMAVQVSGLLTLISFKYSIAENLPTVPYRTFLTTFMQAQIITVVLVSMEGIAAYKITRNDASHEQWLGILEDYMMYVLLTVWLVYFLYAAFGKGRRDWTDVIDGQSETGQLGDVDIEDARRTSETSAGSGLAGFRADSPTCKGAQAKRSSLASMKCHTYELKKSDLISL